MNLQLFRSSLLFGIGSLAVIWTAPALAQTNNKDSDENVGLEEIIVTAQKREQSVQDVPIAVTALTQETLTANRIFSVNDLNSIAPGVTVRPSAGGTNSPAFTIRGQSSFGGVAGQDKQVSIYLDGVYISSPRGSIFDLPDVERLEVLRGPQGTLFGRNATAGAISVTTRDPTGEAGAKVTGSFGNYDAYRVRVSVDTPQVGPLSAYFSFMRNYKRGDIANAGAGTVWDRSLSPANIKDVAVSPKYLGTADTYSYFAAVKLQASDDFKLVYKFDRSDDHGTSDGTAITGYNPAFPLLGSSAPLIAPILNALYTSQNIYLNPSNRRPDTVTNSFVVPREQKVLGHSLTATWNASDSITVKNILAYRESHIFGPTPIDGLGAITFTQAAVVPFATLSAVSTLGAGFFALTPAQQGATIGQFAAGLQSFVGGRFIAVASQADNYAKQWSNELQVNYTSADLNITVGGLWFHSKDESGGPLGMANTLSFTLPPLPASGLIPLGNEGHYSNQATSLAAYAQIEYSFTDKLQFVGGARLTHDKKTSQFRWNSLVNGVIVPRPDIVPPEYTDTRPSFLAGLNYKPNESTLVYGKWSNSYVSGGSVAGIGFVPETVSSWELGLKSDFLDRRLRTNLALFYVNYANSQGPNSITSSPENIAFLNAKYGNLGTLLASSLSTFVQQAYDVRAKGFELEVTALPAKGLTIGGSLSYTDMVLRNFDPAFIAINGPSYLPTFRPKWTGSGYFSYDSQPLFGGSFVNVRMDALYTSKQLFAPNQAARAAQGFPLNSLGTPGYVTLNGRIALKNIEFGTAKGELAVWGRNLTDVDYANSVLHVPFGTAANYLPARTYGVELSVEF